MVRTGLTSGFGGTTTSSTDDEDKEEESTSSSSSSSQRTQIDRGSTSNGDGSTLSDVRDAISVPDTSSTTTTAARGGGQTDARDPSGSNNTDGGSEEGVQTEDSRDTAGAGNITPNQGSTYTTYTNPGTPDDGGGDPSGANQTDGNTTTSDSPPDDGGDYTRTDGGADTFDTSRQTLGTRSNIDEDTEVTTSGDRTDSSPAGGAGLIESVSRFTGLNTEDVEAYDAQEDTSAIELSQKASDTFTEASRDAREAGYDVDTLDALGSTDSGEGALSGLTTEINEAVEEGDRLGPTSEGSETPAGQPNPEGANNVRGDRPPGQGPNLGPPGRGSPASRGPPGSAGPPGGQGPPGLGGGLPPGLVGGGSGDGGDGGILGGALPDSTAGQVAVAGGAGAVGLGAAWYLGFL